MVCSACQDKPVKNQCEVCGKLPPVLQVKSEECPVIFHTVELEGTAEDHPPYIGMYKNTLLVYTADSNRYLFNSDGVYTSIGADGDFNSLTNRPKYAGAEMTSDTNIPDVDNAIATERGRAEEAERLLSSSITDEATSRSEADSTIESKMNTNVLSELEMSADATSVEFVESKKNLLSGTTVSETDTIPLASETQAGILNAAGYQSIKNSQDRLDALAGGAVSISGLPANPTQSQLTSAWETATGQEAVFNRASIFDSTNGKNWTYFTNTTAWEVTGEINQTITLEDFSLGQAGLIVGNNEDGTVYAEQDGTGSVYGWDSLKGRVSDAESNIISLGTGKQDKLTAGTNITIDQDNIISASSNTYTAGTGLNLVSNEFSVNTNVIATKSYADGLVVSYSALNGAGAPTTATEGKYVGQLYYDTTNDDLYFCSAITAQGTDPETYTYTWDTIGGGGSSVNVVQTTGTSTTDIMSQKAVTNMIFPEGSESSHSNILVGSFSSVPSNLGSSNIHIGGYLFTNNNAKERVVIGHQAGNTTGGDESVMIGHVAYSAAEGVALGHSATVQQTSAIAIGSGAQAFANNTIAIGSKIRVNHTGSVVIGNSSTANKQYTTRNNEFCVHASTTANQPMVHSNVDTPTLGTDAANKNYVDTAIASAGAPAYTPSEFNTLWENA